MIRHNTVELEGEAAPDAVALACCAAQMSAGLLERAFDAMQCTASLLRERLVRTSLRYHTVPYGATRSHTCHTVPYGATRSHTCHAVPYGAMRSHTVPRGPTRCLTVPSGPIRPQHNQRRKHSPCLSFMCVPWLKRARSSQGNATNEFPSGHPAANIVKAALVPTLPIPPQAASAAAAAAEAAAAAAADMRLMGRRSVTRRSAGSLDSPRGLPCGRTVLGRSSNSSAN